MVKIFSAHIRVNNPSDSGDNARQQLERAVNAYLDTHSLVEVLWLQSSGVDFTTLTAIVTTVTNS
jgi:hypothetical protein